MREWEFIKENALLGRCHIAGHIPNESDPQNSSIAVITCPQMLGEEKKDTVISHNIEPNINNYQKYCE